MVILAVMVVMLLVMFLMLLAFLVTSLPANFRLAFLITLITVLPLLVVFILVPFVFLGLLLAVLVRRLLPRVRNLAVANPIVADFQLFKLKSSKLIITIRDQAIFHFL